ncbi:hypothetical protein DPMN_145830 [Dreissena polymorpha]|uniref:Fibrinogen C-terminal domain-containing protein n=2 Tax=Dreissena polymorpha TaxID=45954 RepID=A0A9D4IXW7_DREPO|nr:hypothetical protein DPMN_145830 [Dreissena polymorpha]
MIRRLDKLEDDVFKIRNDIIEDLRDGLRDELRDLRKDLKEERDLIREDISTLFNMLTKSSGQVDRHQIEEVSKAKQGSCNCGATLSQFENVISAFKREKSENIMLRKEFNEMIKQHDDFYLRFNNAERKLRSEIDIFKNETRASFSATQKLVHDIQKDNQSEKVMLQNAFNEIRKQHDAFDSRLKSAERNLRSDIDKHKNETKADITATQKLLHTIQSDTRAYCDDRLIHLNESLNNRSWHTLHEISRISSDIANLKTSNENLKNVSDDIIRRQNKNLYSCDGVAVSGEYIINPYGMKVYCEVDSTNKGWMVIQRRMDGSVDFRRSWADYKSGFGNLGGEFWLGNENIYKLTKDKPRELRIDMETYNGTRYALYSEFNVSSESEKYLLYAAGYTGDAGDGFNSFNPDDKIYHTGQSFSTFDADNDLSDGCCACWWGGGWWYTACFTVNLNGKYYIKKTDHQAEGIHWYPITGFRTSLKFVQIKIH